MINPQSVCVFCLALLKPDETYCCEQCRRENERRQDNGA